MRGRTSTVDQENRIYQQELQQTCHTSYRQHFMSTSSFDIRFTLRLRSWRGSSKHFNKQLGANTMKLNNENKILGCYYFHGRHQISIIGGGCE